MQQKYRIHVPARAKEQNTVLFGKFRFTILTGRLIRIEFGTRKSYVDLPTQMVWFRDFPTQKYHLKEEQQTLCIETDDLKILCKNHGEQETDVYLILKKKIAGKTSTWRSFEEIKTLKGTVRTLDLADGEIPLEEGLLSREGFGILDDSRSYLILENGELEKRSQEEKDVYIWGYGHDYKQCLKDFFRLTGRAPLLPRYAFGNWWSRFHAYTEEEYLSLMDRFFHQNIPITVAVIDMDWHLTNIDSIYGSGWTGYTWNRELFPNPQRFLGELHKRGLRTSLNVHPADGVRAFEEAYEQMAADVGEQLHVDKSKKESIAFDAASPVFMEAYFKYLHEPNEDIGVDFWWIDWQQGNQSALPDLDPLWVLNHYHYLHDKARQKRPMILSRYAGAGSHRYPIGFSGDTYITWESFAFQPYFTATASNIAYGFWSHDIGGHMLGSYDEELQIRWVQWGVFSPIMRMHSSGSKFTHKEPWNYSLETCCIIKRYLQLRHRMIPYLYTLNYNCYKEGEMVIRPIYYEEPEKEEAYHCRNEYFFGSEMICLPITTRKIAYLQMSKVTGWLPDGIYIDWQTGIIYQGNRWHTFYRKMEEIPVLLKAGAIVVCDGRQGGNSVNNPDCLSITIAAGKNGRFTLYEDEGEGFSYQKGKCVFTEFRLDYEKKGEFCISGSKGDLGVIPEKRRYELHFLGFENMGDITEIRGKESIILEKRVVEEKNEIVVTVEGTAGEMIGVCFQNKMRLAKNKFQKLCFDVLDKAEISYSMKEEIYDKIKHEQGQPLLEAFAEMDIGTELKEALTERIMAQEDIL